MKRVCGIIAVCLFFIVLVSATVDVNNLTFDKYYIPFVPLNGEINLSIVREDFTQDITSSELGSISFEDFLNANTNDYSCNPSDCSMGYNVIGEDADGSFSIINNWGKKIFGFVIYGDEITLNKDIFNFTISSSFGENDNRPLTIDFFEGGYVYEFNEFSDQLSEEKWGCYNNFNRQTGPRILGSVYCEQISLTETGGIFVGALVDNSLGIGTKDLEMSVYSGGVIVSDCSYNPNEDSGCSIGGNDISFPLGSYDICVSSSEGSSTDHYRIWQETSGETCGFIKGSGGLNSTKDYAIFAQIAKFANAEKIELSAESIDSMALDAERIIEEIYGRDCTYGCVLPIEIEGVSQNFKIEDISIGYVVAGEGDEISTKVYNLESIPAMVDFEGVLDLSLAEFYVSKEGTFKIFLGDVIIFEEDLEKTLGPIVTSISPTNPPAGVPITFYVGVDFNPNINLTYKWDFGDGSIEETNVNFVEHVYENLTTFPAVVEVSAGGNLTGKGDFIITVVSPAEFIDFMIKKLRSLLNNIDSKLRTFPSWYGELIEEIADVNSYIYEIDSLENKKNRTYIEEELINIAQVVYSLDVPQDILINSDIGFSFLTEPKDINLEEVLNVAGGSSGDDLDLYRDPVLRWQSENIILDVSTDEFLLINTSGKTKRIFRTYSINVKSNTSDESYFFINRPFVELKFNPADVDAKKSGDITYLILEPGEELSFEFSYSSPEETRFFASPRLSYLVIEADIDESCNSNFVCEEGEDYKTCRTDCKPTNLVIIYTILIILFILFIYTLLQLWYSVHYENYLFDGDRKQLFNILMYITNARTRNIGDREISRELKKKGWSREKVRYVMKKSMGKRTGLFEIIPIEKVRTYFRNRSAKKKIVTNSEQQSERNINKYAFRRSSGIGK
jgi:hypothetical protein